MFSYKTKVRLHQTDAAGVIFFAEFFTIAHDCYEEFLSQETSVKQILNDRPFIIPIVHAEADYKQPLMLSQEIEVKLFLASTGESSFSLKFQIISEEGKVAAEVNTVHAIINKETKCKASIPPEIQSLLSSLTA